MFKGLSKIKPATYQLPKEGIMRVPGLIIATEEQLQEEDLEKPLIQVRNVASLPGIVGYSIAMPDMHWGYGFPIGGVAAMDMDTGIISPGGVGYDINCGVRLAIAPVLFRELSAAARKALLTKIFQLVPSGAGRGRAKDKSISGLDYKHLVREGAKWSIDQGCGFSHDLEHMESGGVIEGGDIQAVSADAQLRGQNQLGSIGSGNHFVEIGEIETIFLPQIAEKWNVKQGQTYILIHTGSRGFGHQICQDFLNEFIKKGFANDLPDKQLVSAPIQSPEGKRYWTAMASASNFAFNNRQQILHSVRLAFKEVLGLSSEQIFLLYDVCHNIAKIETHPVNGKPKQLCVHRKGATRAYGPGAPELAPIFRDTGQPVLVPGDMGRGSHLMVGQGNPLTWCSSCHGAGRAHSRMQELAIWKNKDPIEYMKSQNVDVMAHSKETVAEEMPSAYKKVDIVVEAVEQAQLAKKVAALRPSLVLKG